MNLTERQEMIATVKSTIRTCTIDEFREIQKVFHERWPQLLREGTRNFKIGDKVKWTCSNHKRRFKGTHEGTIRAINVTTISVIDTNGTRWKCSSTGLTKIV